jgi:hypothetical protein
MIELDLLADGSEYDYTQITVLDGVSTVFRLLYNERREVWTLSLSLEDDTSLIDGQTVVMGVDLLRRCFVTGRPPGNLFAASYTADNTTPGLTDLGKGARVRLFYVPFEELNG